MYKQWEMINDTAEALGEDFKRMYIKNRCYYALNVFLKNKLLTMYLLIFSFVIFTYLNTSFHTHKIKIVTKLYIINPYK